MKLVEARQVINQQLDLLDFRRNQIKKQLDEQHSSVSSYDRLELSKELESLDQAYDETFQKREDLNEFSAAIQNVEASKQQAEAEAEANKEMLKCLEIFRRIANGDKVPAYDEQKLMEYNSKMYMAARSMSIIAARSNCKEHRSLWEDEEPKQDSPDPVELAEQTEVTLAMPKIPESSVSETCT